MRHIDLIVLHCSATNPTQDITASDIDAWHHSRGWSGIGYHWVIRRDGTTEQGRPEERIGAHVYGYNKASIGVCLVGGIDMDGNPDNNFTNAQWSALHALVVNLLQRHRGADVLGHRDLSPDVDGDGVIEEWEWQKTCPCFEVSEFMNSMTI